MHFSVAGEYLTVSRITGPHHNLLQLKLGLGDQGHVALEALGAAAGSEPGLLDGDAVVRAVLEGVATANSQLGATFAVTHVRYVQDDSKPESIYRFLAEALAQHFAEQVIG